MGAWVLASVFYVCLLVSEARAQVEVYGIPSRPVRDANGLDVTKGLLVGNDIHSAVPDTTDLRASSTNYQPYNLNAYKIESGDAVDGIDRYSKSLNPYTTGYGYETAQYSDGQNYGGEFSSIEAESEDGHKFLDTTGYKHYQSSTSFNHEGPKQLETITTNSFHKEVAPYDVSSYHENHSPKEEEHAEVHYHQHKHLHKHAHKQEHVHNHKQEHKHDHGHKHEHHGQHDHKHEAQHKHQHQADHKHTHQNVHHHKHQQDHKHAHHASHKHDHKHQQEHKHDHHHGHKHSHHNEHKHSHHEDHKHDHQHGHKHQSEHKHKHDHQGDHKHTHSHKSEHKHHSSHHHKHSQHKH